MPRASRRSPGRLLALLLVAAGPLVYFVRRRGGRGEHVSLHYEDGSMVTLQRPSPGVDRLFALARDAL